MPNQGTESQFEAATIDRLPALPGHRYQYGGEIERDWREVAMVDWLCLKQLKPLADVKEAPEIVDRVKMLLAAEKKRKPISGRA